MATLDYMTPDLREKTFLGHPRGLFLLFIVEMWERFSYYGMRALLVLYLVGQVTGQNPGRGWSKPEATNLYGWYTGLAYLMPVFGGIIADKLIGTHRSMLVGGLIIALGHVTLAISGIGAMAGNELGMSVFVLGLALIVFGTGHFKPTVSVMVGQLYRPKDPRRDGAFTIFYMGINVGAFICAFVCGTLGERYGWHWGFGAAAVGMLLGLFTYTLGRPLWLKGVGLPPEGKPNYAPLFALGSIVLSCVVAICFHYGVFGKIWGEIDKLIAKIPYGAWVVPGVIIAFLLAWCAWYVAEQEQDDRGPTACILLFILFNAVFWLAFEQAGTSLNLFAADMTDRWMTIPFYGKWEMPATWFQSVNPFLIIVLAPLFAGLWSVLGKWNMNPSQPMKIALALLLVGGGYIFMVVGSLGTTPTARASMFWLFATYTVHTFGELCISPTGLSFVTRAAPAKSVSFLMGVWFLSSVVANKLGGTVAGYVEAIESGEKALPWYRWFKLGGQADFFLAFVIVAMLIGLLVLVFTPVLKKLLHGRG